MCTHSEDLARYTERKDIVSWVAVWQIDTISNAIIAFYAELFRALIAFLSKWAWPQERSARKKKSRSRK